MPAGQLGESVGGFQRDVGESRVTRNVPQWRLHVHGPSFPSPFYSNSFQWLMRVPGTAYLYMHSQTPYPYVMSIFPSQIFASHAWLRRKVLFASIASLTALILVPFIIGKRPSKEHLPLVSGTSVLESLRLVAQSEALHSRLEPIEEPRSDRLRAAGMFDVSLGDIGRSGWGSETAD